MPSREDLGPAVEGAAGREGLELEVLARLRQVPVAVAVALASLRGILARRGLVCVRGHLG
jgi:hypothetical protein